MGLGLNNLERLIRYKTQPTNQLVSSISTHKLTTLASVKYYSHKLPIIKEYASMCLDAASKIIFFTEMFYNFLKDTILKKKWNELNTFDYLYVQLNQIK